ncbi:MAG: FHA domain-containing protein [Bryobacteraceae bacterium]
MDRPATAHPATAREIILEIVRNMREGLEPLLDSTLAPSIYHVYLHSQDMDRLRGIAPRIEAEARRALDAELEKLNKASLAERLKIASKIARRGEPKVEAPEGGWQIRLLENTDDGVEPGDIVIYSELAMPAKPEFGAGSMTKRIATRKLAGKESGSQSYDQKPAPAAAPETAHNSASPDAPETAPQTAAAPAAGSLAVIEYEDHGGRKVFQMTKEQIVVGRGGRDYWTDLQLDTLPDVSREHFRLRRDAATGKFFLKDLSRLGTTINGEKAPSSIEFVEGEKRDRNVEAPVPESARIGLADVLFLEFRSAAGKEQTSDPAASYG